MRVTLLYGLLAATIPNLSSALTPLVAHQVQNVGPAQRRHLDVSEFAYVKGRATEIGNFDLSEEFEENKVLVNLYAKSRVGMARANGGSGKLVLHRELSARNCLYSRRVSLASRQDQQLSLLTALIRTMMFSVMSLTSSRTQILRI